MSPTPNDADPVQDPDAFERDIWAAYKQLFISYDEAVSAINMHCGRPPLFHGF